MANNLTGDFDAIFQISVKQINGILATMHQSRIDPNASPTFPHSIIIGVGDLPKALLPSEYFKDWTSGLAARVHETGGSTAEVIPTYYTKSLPGLSALYKEAVIGVVDEHIHFPASDTTRGTAYVQLSNPVISFRGSATEAVIVTVDVRAFFVPDPSTGALPEPIHGQVQAVYLAQTITKGGRRFARVVVPSEDSQIEFHSASGTGLSNPEIDELAGEIRKALRKHFVPTDVDITDLPVSQFIALSSGAGQAIALPLQVPGSAAAGNINSITNHLLGTFEFAIAVSKQYAETQFAPMIQALKNYANALVINVSTPVASTVYHAAISSVVITWKPGAIDFSASIHFHTESILPDQSISFTQTVTLELDVPSQTVMLKAVGDPSVNESSLIDHDYAVKAVKAGRDQALTNPSLASVFSDVRQKLISGMRTFDKYVDVKYLTVEITPDGILLRGKIDSSGRLDPVVHFEETPDRGSFTAFSSWIPGGGIDSYHWTWPEGSAWFSHVAHLADSHRFIIPKPAGIQVASQICLRIEGTRTTADGTPESVTAGDTCKPSWSEPILVVPSWWMKVMIPYWWPDPPSEINLEDAIRGYINVAGQPREPGRPVANTLVHFTGARFEKPLAQLGQVMRQSQRQDGSLMMILVLPAGTLRQTRREVEARLGSLDEQFKGHLIITEDYLDGWTKIFAARELPATFFLNARREFVWKHEGEIDARAFAAALEEHMVPAPAAPTGLMQLAVRPGDVAPDLVLEDEKGEKIVLQQLRGQSVILNFWQSWARPCLRELQRLQRLLHQGVGNPPVVLAINGGEERSVLEGVRRENDFRFPLIYDPDQRIAALFDVQCWPTTVFVNRMGVVDRVQFGLGREDQEEPGKKRARPPATKS